MKCTHIHETYILDKNMNMDQFCSKLKKVLMTFITWMKWHMNESFFHYVNVDESFCSWAAEEHKALAEAFSV
jgi:hypothetical protein